MRAADGRSELLDPPTGAPTGVGGVPFEAGRVAVASGDRLVVRTDGPVGVRGEDISVRGGRKDDVAPGGAGTGVTVVPPVPGTDLTAAASDRPKALSRARTTAAPVGRPSPGGAAPGCRGRAASRRTGLVHRPRGGRPASAPGPGGVDL